MVYDLSKLKKQDAPEDDGSHIELYPSEINQIKSLSARIQKKYGFSPMTDSLQKQMASEVEGEFAALGIIAHITWSVDVSGGNDSNIFHIPTINVVGRMDKESTDYERIQREVTDGEADGKVGFIREDGSFHDDAKRKNV